MKPTVLEIPGCESLHLALVGAGGVVSVLHHQQQLGTSGRTDPIVLCHRGRYVMTPRS